MPRTLAQLDLNLVVALDVLLSERHVTRSARRMGVTQSAMSQTLQRLREMLDDPLLVRRGAAMVPTPRAEALAGPLRLALRSLERVVLDPPAFEPARSDRVFRLAAFDVYAVSLLPRVLGHLLEVAPGVELHVLPVDMERVQEQLRQGEVDLALVRPRESPADIVQQPVIEEVLVSMVRADHPVLLDKGGKAPRKGSPTAKQLARWPHASFRIVDGGPTVLDEHLAAQGLTRRVPLRVPYFLSAPALACETDLVITLPRSVAYTFARRWPVAVFMPPVAPMRYTVSMVWSRHLDADPGLAWLRGLVVQHARALQAELEAIPAGVA